MTDYDPHADARDSYDLAIACLRAKKLKSQFAAPHAAAPAAPALLPSRGEALPATHSATEE